MNVLRHIYGASADLALEKHPGNWVADCAAAAQNMLLASHALGLGAVWTGVFPEEDRMEGFSRMLNLPENVMPHALIVLGYPTRPTPPARDRFKPDRVHINGW